MIQEKERQDTAQEEAEKSAPIRRVQTTKSTWDPTSAKKREGGDKKWKEWKDEEEEWDPEEEPGEI